MIPLRRNIPKLCCQDLRCFSNAAYKAKEPIKKYDQMEYVQELLQKPVRDWSMFKNAILKKRGVINQKNFNGVLLKLLTNDRKFDIATSFLNHIRLQEKVLTLGTMNGLLQYYFAVSKVRDLSDEEKLQILNCYKDLYDKYKILDSTTSERLLHALCIIGEHEKAIKVLEDIKQSATPSHSAYGTLIGSLFNRNNNVEALKVIEDSLNNNRPLSSHAYHEWVQYILRNHKTKETILSHLDAVNTQIKNSFTMISSQTAQMIRKTYISLGWNAEFAQIRKQDGRCSCCKNKLKLYSLKEEEFKTLQENVKEKLYGSDLFMKTSPKELQKFLSYVEQTKPYDIVLDALNISYSVRGGLGINKLEVLNTVVNKLIEQNKKVLVIGRKHMLNWQKQGIKSIMSNTCSFFTDDLSQDDPFFITAAILSGAHTDIVSKDLLRGHVFNMKDENLRHLFKRWQWQHQYMVSWKWKTGVQIQIPDGGGILFRHLEEFLHSVSHRVLNMTMGAGIYHMTKKILTPMAR